MPPQHPGKGCHLRRLSGLWRHTPACIPHCQGGRRAASWRPCATLHSQAPLLGTDVAYNNVAGAEGREGQGSIPAQPEATVGAAFLWGKGACAGQAWDPTRPLSRRCSLSHEAWWHRQQRLRGPGSCAAAHCCASCGDEPGLWQPAAECCSSCVWRSSAGPRQAKLASGRIACGLYPDVACAAAQLQWRRQHHGV